MREAAAAAEAAISKALDDLSASAAAYEYPSDWSIEKIDGYSSSIEARIMEVREFAAQAARTVCRVADNADPEGSPEYHERLARDKAAADHAEHMRRLQEGGK